MLFCQFPLSFFQTQNGKPLFIVQLMAIFVWAGWVVFPINWEMFHRRIYLNLMFLRLPGSRYFCWIANSVLNKDKSFLPPLFIGLEVLFSASAKLLAENFSKNSNIDDSGISVPAFSSKTNLKLYNISVTPKLVKKSHNQPWFVKSIWYWLFPLVGLKNC